jgi:hypothetical protein
MPEQAGTSDWRAGEARGYVMANVDTGTQPGDGTSKTRRSNLLEDGFMFSTEARPGIITSEFLLTLITSLVVVVAAYISETVPQRWGWAFFTAIIVAYILSRGIAKAGSKEGPFIVRTGDTEQ